MNLKLEWKLNGDPLADIGFAISRTVLQTVRKQFPELADMFPFNKCWELQGYFGDSWMVITIVDRPESQVPTVGALADEAVNSIKRRVAPFTPRDYNELFNLLGDDWFSFDRFTYLGPYQQQHACWPDFCRHLERWLDHLVLPTVFKRNQARVMRAIPAPPQFNIRSINDALWVLESEQAYTQGTGFMLAGIGLVTCQHVLADDTVAFRPDKVSEKHPVKVLAHNSTTLSES